MSPANSPRPTTSGGIFQPLDRLADPISRLPPGVHAAARSSARRVTASTRSRRKSALVVMSSIGSTAAVAAAAAARNVLSPGARAGERALGFGNAPRIGFGAADRKPRLDDFSAFDAVGGERRGHGEIAGAAAELVKAATRVGGKHRQPRLDQQFIVAQRRRHDALEEIARRDGALAARALGQNLAVERRQHQRPFGRWIGVRQAAAERAAVADRIMGDVAHHVGEQLAERALADRAVERGMAHTRADHELAVGDGEPIERIDAVDVDEMSRLGEPERHGRHQALAAGEHASVLRGDFGEQRHRLIDGFRRVITERRRLHRLVSSLGLTYVFELMHGFRHRVKRRHNSNPA